LAFSITIGGIAAFCALPSFENTFDYFQGDENLFAGMGKADCVLESDYPDGRLEITHEGTTLPYRTFDKLRSVNRSEIVGNKRLDAVLAMVADMQAGRELKRSQRAPRRTGQTNHMFGIPDGSVSNGYQKQERRKGP